MRGREIVSSRNPSTVRIKYCSIFVRDGKDDGRRDVTDAGLAPADIFFSRADPGQMSCVDGV